MATPKFYLHDCCKTNLPLAIWDEHWVFRSHALHYHDCIVIMFVYRGIGVCGISKELYPLRTGSMYVIPEGDSHWYKSEDGMRFFNIMFSKDLFRTPEEQFLYRTFIEHFRKSKVFSCSADKCRHLQDILIALEQAFRSDKDPLSEIHIRAMFTDLLCQMLRNPGNYVKIQPSTRNEMTISRIHDYINIHFREKITLESAAAQVHMSPAYLGQLFKKLTGENFSSHICRLRVDETLNDLVHSSKTVAELSSEFGFYDPAHYIKMFQRYYHQSPAQYRKKHQPAPECRVG